MEKKEEEEGGELEEDTMSTPKRHSGGWKKRGDRKREPIWFH